MSKLALGGRSSVWAFALLLVGQAQSPERLANQGKWAEAERAFVALEGTRSLSFSELKTAVEISTRLNNWNRVAQLLANFRRRHTLTHAQKIQLYEAYLKTGDKESAEKELIALVRERLGDEQPVHLLAFLYLSQEKLGAAAALYRQYLGRNPRALESRINLALIDFKLDRADEAFAHLKRAFALNPKQANEYFYRQLVRNMPPEGLAELAEDTKKELGLPGEGPLVHLHLAREYDNLKRYDNAISEYEKYLAGKPGDTETRFALAKLYFQVGDSAKSEELLSDLIGKPGNLGNAARLLAAELAVKSSEIERASQLLDQLPSSYRSLPAYQYLEARVALSRGENQTAENLLEKVIRRAPEISEAYFHLGQLYLRTGREQKGRDLLAEFERKKAESEHR